jgi:acyl carrier protein
MMLTHQEIYAKVQKAVAESLNVDEEDIHPAARLLADLGAESIDFLDLVFRLEQGFGIEIPRSELFPESIFKGDPEFVQDGKITAKGLAELQSKMPFADLTQFENAPTLSGISDLFTVQMITRYVGTKLDRR